MARIRKNDIVTVVRGVNTGKTGKVLSVMPKTGRAIVEGINIVKKHLRKSQENPKGAIAEKEAPMPAGKLMPFCPSCKRGVRLSLVKDGAQHIRKCKRCGHAFDS